MRLFSHVTIFIFLCSTSFASPSEKAVNKLKAVKATAEAEKWTFNVDYNPMMEFSLAEITGFKEDKDLRQKRVYQTASRVRDLPAQFDWREELDSFPPIKNQRNCGSCWAFGTVAVLESIIKIRDGQNKNISEQHLVSCNRDGWSCGGGWFAHDYHKTPGSVSTEAFPYVARDVSCKSGLGYQDKILSWSFVGGEGRKPTTEEIKAAILEYGVVAVTVSATSSMQAYSGGIYNNCTGRNINHLVNLVGWNDNGGYWIMRNSWGASWGENGYMRIKYGCNRIGDSTSFVKYKTACQPQPIVYTGEDKTIVAGESVFLGGMPIPGQTYQWTPADSLDDASAPHPLATPAKTTVYKLTVTNPCGTAEKSLTVTVK